MIIDVNNFVTFLYDSGIYYTKLKSRLVFTFYHVVSMGDAGKKRISFSPFISPFQLIWSVCNNVFLKYGRKRKRREREKEEVLGEKKSLSMVLKVDHRFNSVKLGTW